MSLILVIYFIFIIIKLNYNKKVKFPPIDSECPNYYIPENKLGRKFCKARPIYKIYNKNCDIVDITDMTELEKCNWSSGNKVCSEHNYFCDEVSRYGVIVLAGNIKVRWTK